MSHASPPQDEEPRRSEKIRPVEFLLVATVASVVGAMAVPHYTPDTGSMKGFAQLTQLQYQVDTYRNTLDDYRADHLVYPGYKAGRAGAWLHGELSSAQFNNQLLLWSDQWGHTGQMSPGRMELGPYFDTGMPKNPINGLNTVTLLGDTDSFPPVPDQSTGWYFKPHTGELRANCAGQSELTGKSYYQL